MNTRSPRHQADNSTARQTQHAFIDESGVRGRSKNASKFFVMSAVVIADEDLSRATALLAQLRTDLGRSEGDTLHWRNFRGHAPRLHASKTIGAQDWITISSVVVAKDHLGNAELNDDQAYLYTFRYLLERLSWFAREHGRVLNYTLAHIVRFQIAKLREYEATLRTCQTGIEWDYLDPHGGRIDQPERIENLQLADTVASATAAGFEPDTYGNTEPRYLTHLADRLYRRNGNLTSYGLKMHPWTDNIRAAYPWVAAL